MAPPLGPIYPLTGLNESIVVHDGPIDVDGHTSHGRIAVQFEGGLKIRWEAEVGRSFGLLGKQTVRLTLDRPDLGTVVVPASVGHSSGIGHVDPVSLGSGDRITRAVMTWINCPEILPAAGLDLPGAEWTGRWLCESDAWLLTLDLRSDCGDLLRDTWGRRVFLPTHVGELRRRDGSSVDGETAAEVLFAAQLALSFALGRWVAPALPVGVDADGARVWEQWVPWWCDEMYGFLGWWDSHAGHDLSDLVGRVLDARPTSDWPVVHHLARHAIAAGHRGTTTEARLMLAQAGLEYLAWNDYRFTGRLSKSEYKKGGFGARLRDLLRDNGLSTEVPAALGDLASFANDKGLDAPTALTRVRNMLTHPKDASEPYGRGRLVWESWCLCLEQLELLLLRRLGYCGTFRRRYPPGRFEHDSEPVPWAAAQGPNAR